MSNKINKTDAIDEALKIVFLNSDKDNNSVIEPATQLKYIIEADYPNQMNEELSKKMSDRLYNKLAVDSLGILVDRALKSKNMDVSKLSEDVNLPIATIEQLQEDTILANSIPVISFKNLMRILEIPIDKVTHAVIKTFHVLRNEVAFSPASISSLKCSYRRRNARATSSLNTKAGRSEKQYLFQNEEALNKYLKRLEELY